MGRESLKQRSSKPGSSKPGSPQPESSARGNLRQQLAAVDASLAARIQQYYLVVVFALVQAVLIPIAAPTSLHLAKLMTHLPGVPALADAIRGTPCAPHLPGLVLALAFLTMLLVLCWLIFLGGILPRVLAATRKVASANVIPKARPGLIDHGIERQGADAPAMLVAMIWLVFAVIAGGLVFVPIHLVGFGCASMASVTAPADYLGWSALLILWGVAFSAPHALLRLLQGSILQARWSDRDKQPRRPSPMLQARARQKAAAVPLARDLPKAPMVPSGPAPFEEDGTPVPDATPRYPTPHEAFKALAALWASEATQAARANDDYPTGFMQGRRQYYEFLAKSARKQDAAIRHGQRQNGGNINKRQVLKEQIATVQKALAGARSHGVDLHGNVPERRTTEFEIQLLRRHLMDLEARLHGQ